MNKTAIKNFAIWARVQLIEAAKQRAFLCEITEKGENKPGAETAGGRVLSKEEKQQRDELINQIMQKGYEEVMEEAAYTWFNRFIALRFMEVNGYLPSKIRVFTNENGEFKPEILNEAMTVEFEGVDRSTVMDLLEKQNNEELYKYLLIAQCNALNPCLPGMFEKISNWTELLFPANLLREDSVIGKMVTDIPEEDWTDAVEIIGWLYQYYISEKHEEVIDPLHGKTIKKEDVPAATQLFTTDWVVRYILDNSLGRYWVERHPESKLNEKLEYFVVPKDGVIPRVNESIRPEELRVLDPCVGSGHFLSYAFDVLLEIYRESGYSDRDAAALIITKNLFGIDIDDRAAQLAYFAVMMKARRFSRRILSEETRPNVVSIQESNWLTGEFINYVAGNDTCLKKDLTVLQETFKEAKEYGSILSIPPIHFDELYDRIDVIGRSYIEDVFQLQFQKDAKEKLLLLVKQAEILAGKYEVVATNPPYLNRYNANLKAYISKYFEAYKGDLFSVFMYRNFDFCRQGGYTGFMTPLVWMFIKTYEELRKYIINQKSICSLIQFEYSAFEEATVPICSFILRNGTELHDGYYFRLSDFKGGMDVQKNKFREAINNHECGYYFETAASNFLKIPGSPVAYWVSESFLKTFDSKKVDDYASTNNGFTTGDNNLFLRCWFEVEYGNLCFRNESIDTAEEKKEKWFPYNKGGDFRKWYGNNDFVINWGNNGQEIKAYGHLVPRSLKYQFKECASWNKITSGTTAFRYKGTGTMFDVAGLSMFPKEKSKLLYLLALCNSVYTKKVLEMLSPTLNCETGHVASLPVIFDPRKDVVDSLAKENIELSRADWDSFENSWDFKKNPLV